MSIYIGNDLENRLKALEAENASLRKYNKYHQVVHEIDHVSDLHVDSSFYKHCIVFKMTNIASGDQLFVNSLIGNSDETANSKFITFYRT